MQHHLRYEQQGLGEFLKLMNPPFNLIISMILKDHVTKREEWGFTYSDTTSAIALEVLALVNGYGSIY